jgi:hypothetical protein
MAVSNPSNADVLQASAAFPTSPVPEPMTAELFSSGILGILSIWLRRARTGSKN